MKMTTTESARLLRGHNAWRRDEVDMPHVQTPPRRLGIALDMAVVALEQLTSQYTALATALQDLPRYAVTKQHGVAADPEGNYLHRDLVVAALEKMRG